MRFLILFFCIFTTLLVSAQADSTAFVIKDGQVFSAQIKETPIGDLNTATKSLIENIAIQTLNFSSDIQIVKSYEKQINALVKYVNNFTDQTKVNVWDSLLQRDPILLKRDWYLDGRDTLFFRVNSNNVFQYRIGVNGKWNRCYYLINAIVFNGSLKDVFFRKGNGFEAFNGSKINQDIRAGSRSVMAPFTPPIIVYENGVVYIEGAYLRWDNKAKKWVDTTPPSVGVKQL